MENKSGLEPRGVAVLVEPYEPELKAGNIVIPDQVRAQMAQVDNRAIVIQVGPTAWADESEPRARPGDRVLVTKFAGYMATGPKDGKQYRLVNDRDIFCRLTD